MFNSKNHCSLVFSTPNRLKIFQRGYKWLPHEALCLINPIWNVCNKTTNLQAKTYFSLQNILNMILTRRVNNDLGM